MTGPLDDGRQQLAANAICHAAEQAGYAIQLAASQYERPSAIYRPAINIDGNQWCALYGANLQDGVAGFGDSPALAMHDFDKEWTKKLVRPQMRADGGKDIPL